MFRGSLQNKMYYLPICLIGAMALVTADPIYYESGVQMGVGESVVEAGGWEMCFSKSSGESADLPLASCTGEHLMLACRLGASVTLQVLAMAPRYDVLFDTGRSNTPHNSNGVGWYYSDSYSWGFAPEGDEITRQSCDTASTNGDQRLCWHTSDGRFTTGYRCGNGLSGVYERVVFHLTGYASLFFSYLN